MQITFQIGGVAIIGLATWALLDKVPWIGELVGNDLLTGAIYVLLVAGIIVALTSFFGCLGASREVKCMLLTVNLIMPRSYVFNKPKVYWSNYVIKKNWFQYFIIVFLLFVTILIGGVLAYVFREKLMNTLEREMSSSMRLYDSRKAVREAWDMTQSKVSARR